MKNRKWLYVIGFFAFVILSGVIVSTCRDSSSETKSYQNLNAVNKTSFSTPIYVVALRGANIRTEPSIQAQRYGAVPYGTRLEYYYSQGQWYRVKANGYEGWVHSSIVSTSYPRRYQYYSERNYYKPHCAENNSCYGDISVKTGRPKTVYVRGYYRKDGTYVRGHYRSKPRR